MNKNVIVIILLVAFVIGIGIWFFVTHKQDLPEFLQPLKNEDSFKAPDKNDDENVPSILYYPADFSENIYDDEVYLELVGPYVLHYKSGDMETSFTGSDIEKSGDFVNFFYDFIETVKNGNNNTYNSYFFDEYYKTHTKMNEFTMQKIYDVHIEEIKVNVNLDPDEYSWVAENNLEPVYFNVKYKIRQNNGSFRLGVSSDAYRPQLFILAYDKNGDIKIIDIVAYAA